MSRVVTQGTLVVQHEQGAQATTSSVQCGFDGGLQTAFLMVFVEGQCRFNSQLDPETATSRLDFDALADLADQKAVYASHAFWRKVYEFVEGEIRDGMVEV